VSLRRPLTVVAIAALAALTACGSDGASGAPSADASAASSAGATTAAAAPTGEADPDDVEFAQGMIAHHEQAIAMSEIVLDPAAQASSAVTDLAARIKAAQDPEIGTMTAWLQARGLPVEMSMDDGHDMDAMPGMVAAADLDELATLKGAALDERFLTLMVAHHEGAIEMADAVLAAGPAGGVDPELRALAEAIVAGQRTEIDEMNRLLAG
jgi:uncharacterized protein (DUF305 family)